LEFVCDLVLEIWNFIHPPPTTIYQRPVPNTTLRSHIRGIFANLVEGKEQQLARE